MSNLSWKYNVISKNYSFIEDEGETFQVKKSSFSRKIHRERKKEKNKSNNEKPIKNISNNSQNSNNNSQRDNNSPTVTKESNYVKEIQSESDGFSVRLLLFNFYINHLPLYSIFISKIL